MKKNKLEKFDFGYLIELEEGTSLVTSPDKTYIQLNKKFPDLNSMFILRRVNTNLIEAMVCKEGYSLKETGAKKNGKPIFKYLGDRYEYYNMEPGYAELDALLKTKGL